MKMRVLIDHAALGAWKKKPWGYAVLKITPSAKIEAVATGSRIVLVRVSPNVNRAARQLEKIREVFDIDPNGMRPRVVVVPAGIAADPRNAQFMSRAALTVEV